MTTERTPDKNRRLLIVETDDLIRELLVRWLTEAGYLVEMDDSTPRGVALVIADVPNPAQAAVVLRALSVRHGGAPILAISGRFRRDVAASEDAARRFGVARMLPKPFTCKELLTAVARCLGGG
ncbi:hypothetical protein QTI24_20625 [Variovorax sp. J22P240]|uniref:hypothetical protein n=1 Tax=Variovorax sp. J22P240 TaxID=3053514 RepID=UPI00257532FC|nr:hypothetical protein [Variovorax sp. J22P240]MDM0001026.1 hypothetical protein [Variovorax sp. J22P240]